MEKHLKVMAKSGFALAIFALVSVVFVSTSERLTREKIAENKAMMLLMALNEVVPPSAYTNNIIDSKVILTKQQTGFIKDTPVYFAIKDNNAVAAIFEVVTLKGYSGAIKVLVGVDANDKSITGVRVVDHKETPGLGDKMELRKSNWVLSFNGKLLTNQNLQDWHVQKDGGKFKQFTGATITPRAIVNLVRSTLLYAQDHLDELFSKQLTKKVK